MKKMHKMASHLGGFSSGESLGGTVSRYRGKQNIYKQGAPAHSLSTFKKAAFGSLPEQKANPPQSLPSWARMISLASFALRAILFACPRPSR